jgi:hypothetical protein
LVLLHCKTEQECIELEQQMIEVFGHWKNKKNNRKKVGTRKFHRLFHMANSLRQFGNLDVTCSGRWEHYHKFVAKRQYLRTSRRKENYSREMHEVHLFLRHLEALTEYQELHGSKWFEDLGKAACTKGAAGTEGGKLQRPLPACGFVVRPHSAKFSVNTTAAKWTGGSGCHLSAHELAQLKIQVQSSFRHVDDELLFYPDITLHSTWYEAASGRANFKIRATASFHNAPWFDAVRLEVIPADAGEVTRMRAGKGARGTGKTFTMPQKIHGFAQVLGIFTNSTSPPDLQNQGSSVNGSSDTDEESSGCPQFEASVFVRWLGGMYQDGEKDANIYEKPVPVSRAIGHMKEIESPTTNPYQIFQAGQNAILAPVWLIPEPGQPGQYFAVKNDDKGTWHQFGEVAAPATACSSGSESDSSSDDEPLAAQHAAASASASRSGSGDSNSDSDDVALNPGNGSENSSSSSSSEEDDVSPNAMAEGHASDHTEHDQEERVSKEEQQKRDAREADYVKWQQKQALEKLRHEQKKQLYLAKRSGSDDARADGDSRDDDKNEHRKQ